MVLEERIRGRFALAMVGMDCLVFGMLWVVKYLLLVLGLGWAGFLGGGGEGEEGSEREGEEGGEGR